MKVPEVPGVVRADELLRLARAYARVSQAQLASAAGMSQATVCEIETGRRRPSLVTLARLLAGVGLQARWTLEPLDAEVERVIEAGRRNPVERWRRVRAMSDVIEGTLRAAGVPHVVTGLAAAVVQGAPVPVDWWSIAVERRDTDALLHWLGRVGAVRWSEERQDVDYYAGRDLEDPGASRWAASIGRIEVVLVDERPPSVRVRLDYGSEDEVDVIPLHLVAAADPAAARILDVLRRRVASSP